MQRNCGQVLKFSELSLVTSACCTGRATEVDTTRFNPREVAQADTRLRLQITRDEPKS